MGITLLMPASTVISLSHGHMLKVCKQSSRWYKVKFELYCTYVCMYITVHTYIHIHM